jgi:FkbM family methyltransferase
MKWGGVEGVEGWVALDEFRTELPPASTRRAHGETGKMPAVPANPPANQLRDRLNAFVAWWRENIIGDEKGQSQVFLDRLFKALGHEGVFEAGATLEDRIKAKSRGGTAFADLVWKPRMLIEMKKRGEDQTRPARSSASRTREVDERYRPYEFAGGLIYLDVDESPAMRRRAEGSYEPEKVAALQRLLEPGMTFVDAGSNKGDFALIAARVMRDRGRVLAFEPSPDNCRWIRASVELNGYRSIRLFELALYDTEGHGLLYLGQWSGWHSLEPGDAPGESIEVETRTLDTVLAETGDPGVDVLKVDVEGAELQVLRGAERALAGPRLVAVFVELHPDHGVDQVEVSELLLAHGFSFRDPLDIDVELSELPPGARHVVAMRRRAA